MPASAFKKPGDPVLVRRKGETPALEGGWRFVRFEPDSGNLIAEKGGKRVACARSECRLLNFPGSGAVWDLIESEPDDDNLRAARSAWTELDLSRASSRLLEYGRSLDPSFGGAQTAADYAAKTLSLAESCESALTVLNTDLKRAEAEYGRCPAGTSSEKERKSELLDRWQGLQAEYAAKAHRRDRLLPACRNLMRCLESIEAARKSSG